MIKEPILFDSINKDSLYKQNLTVQYNGKNYKGFLYFADSYIDDSINYYVYFIEKDYPENIKENEVLVLYIEYRHTLLEIETKCLNMTNNHMQISIPEKIYKIQQREFMRIDCNIPCILNKNFNGVIENISGSGAKIKIKDSKSLKENVSLDFQIDNKKIEIVCDVIGVNDKDIRVNFKTISENNRSHIVSYVLEQDIKFYGIILKTKDEI